MKFNGMAVASTRRARRYGRQISQATRRSAFEARSGRDAKRSIQCRKKDVLKPQPTLSVNTSITIKRTMRATRLLTYPVQNTTIACYKSCVSSAVLDGPSCPATLTSSSIAFFLGPLARRHMDRRVNISVSGNASWLGFIVPSP